MWNKTEAIYTLVQLTSQILLLVSWRVPDIFRGLGNVPAHEYRLLSRNGIGRDLGNVRDRLPTRQVCN